MTTVTEEEMRGWAEGVCGTCKTAFKIQPRGGHRVPGLKEGSVIVLPTLDGCALTHSLPHIAIVGSRDYLHLTAVRRFVRSLPAGTVVVSGGAHGVDRAAEHAARARGLEVIVIKPDWKRYGRQAGFRRNTQIVEQSYATVAFWDFKSRGTANTLHKSVRAGHKVTVFGPSGEKVARSVWRDIIYPPMQPNLFDSAE